MSTNQATTPEPQLLAEQSKGGLMHITLNRPKALNALTLDMVRSMNNLLVNQINKEDSKVGAFLMKGAGGKAFCAGGDVKTIWQELKDLPAGTEIGAGQAGVMHSDFFRDEYIMNYMLAESTAPQVAIWDGFVMGGGVGVSIFGEFRVATEKTVFAMPETAIGLFPDVGGSSWLPHLKDGIGAYVGMTGCRLNAADLLYANMATHFITSDKLTEVESSLKTISIPKDPVQSRKAVKEILDAAQVTCIKPDRNTSAILTHSDTISRCFGKDSTSVEHIFQKLEEEVMDGAWAKDVLKTLRKMSPTSLKLTFEQLKRGAQLDLKGCLRMEYRIVQNCMRSSDFREGIRALLVDRDNNPKWDPSSLEAVSDEKIKAYFEPLGDNDLDVFADKNWAKQE
eukprot:CAMPEP_0170419526 /NCGR_PEP_ID=MMETSP0117_2-20130122/34846_1 /TAXON_ID=400756 /ORGANISM="Durinskia baltica, Strain CSIRO CS-38" /LENGTH=394 /DNA_ID=CAMNT_0010677883 /DNA_START=84 /DNA_END=1268 /DNA_ORIENTATION=-